MQGWRWLIWIASKMCVLREDDDEWIKARLRVSRGPSGELVLSVGNPDLDPEYVRGTVAIARALSREICHECGGAGDPVWPADGQGGTRCAECRDAADEVLPRDEWRRERNPELEQRQQDYRVLEEMPDFESVMDTRHHLDDDDRWVFGDIPAGWRHLLRAAFTLLVHEQTGSQPWRLERP